MGGGVKGLLCATAHELKTKTAAKRSIALIANLPDKGMIDRIVLGI
jgi:hypothetical protein